MIDIVEELYKLNPWWEGEFRISFLPRPKYQNLLKKNLNNKDIIILTGIRRVGKTSIMKLFIKDLLEIVSPEKILYVSLDSYALEDYSIFEIVRAYRKEHKLDLGKKVFLFFDEVAYKENAHQELKNLYDHENVKIFASSSSASILKDKRALLTGRARLIEVLPLDFNEFVVFKGLKIKKSEKYLMEKYFEEYMKMGGIPEYVLTGDISYLDNLIDSIIFKDIISFYGVRDIRTIRDYFRLLMERCGKQVSINKIARILGISPDTSRRYFEYFVNSYVIYQIERCGKLTERIRAPKKIYVADVGIRNMVTGFKDKGAIFENLVFLQIKHLRPCYIYQDGIEIDFLIDGVLMEVKFNKNLNVKQKEFFEKFKAEKKKVIKNIDDYLRLEKGEIN
jgi:hypothetical protein